MALRIIGVVYHSVVDIRRRRSTRSVVYPALILGRMSDFVDDDALEELDQFAQDDLVEVEVTNDEVVDDDDDVEEPEDEEQEGEEEAMDMDIPDMSSLILDSHTDAVYCIAAHPTQPIILTGGGDDRAFLWTYTSTNDTLTATSCTPLTGHTDTITAVGFNYDGSLFFTGAYDGIIQVYSIDGTLQQRLEGPEDIEWATWHSKGNAILAGSKDGTAWMWLAHNGQCMQVLAGHDGPVSAGAFSTDGKTICTAGEDSCVRLWAPKTGQCKHVFSNVHDEMPITCLSTHEDLLMTGGMDGRVALYHISNKKLLKRWTHSASNDEETLSVECVGIATAPGFQWLASGGLDKKLKIWDTTSENCRCVCAHDGGVVALQWHKDLPIVMTGCLDKNVRVWDARSGACLATLTGHRDLVTNILVAKVYGEHPRDAVISVSDDNTARIFQIDLATLLVA